MESPDPTIPDDDPDPETRHRISEDAVRQRKAAGKPLDLHDAMPVPDLPGDDSIHDED